MDHSRPLLLFFLTLALLALHAPSLVTAGTIPSENMDLLANIGDAEDMNWPSPGNSPDAAAASIHISVDDTSSTDSEVDVTSYTVIEVDDTSYTVIEVDDTSYTDIEVDVTSYTDTAVDVTSYTDIAVDVTADATDPVDVSQIPFDDAYIAFYDHVYRYTQSRVTRHIVKEVIEGLEEQQIPTTYYPHNLQEQEHLTRVIYQTFQRYLPVCDVTAFDPFFSANNLQLQNHLRYSYDETTREFSFTLEFNANVEFTLKSVMDRPDNTCKLFEAIDTVLSDLFLFEGPRPQSHALRYAAIDRRHMDKIFVALVKVIYESQGVYNPFGAKWERLLGNQIQAITVINMAPENSQDYTLGEDLDKAIVRILRWIRAGPHLLT